jgi:hypothetical protein
MDLHLRLRKDDRSGGTALTNRQHEIVWVLAERS